LKELFLKATDWYCVRFPFPKRGLKYFLAWINRLGLNNRDFQKKTKNGVFFSLDLRDHLQKQIFWYGSYENQYTQFLLRLLRPGYVFFDIGANIGYYGLTAAAKIGSSGKVHCFEPASQLFQRIQKNIALNRFENILANQVAVSDGMDKMKLYLSSGDNLGMTGLTKASNFSGIEELTETIILDKYIQIHDLKRVDIVKIDIEGHEMAALRGMTTMIDRFKPLLLIEVLKTPLMRYDQSPRDIYRFLLSKGYQPYDLQAKNKLVKIVSEEKEGSLIVFAHQDDQRIQKYILSI
jgi:FkbM family methyltransferase